MRVRSSYAEKMLPIEETYMYDKFYETLMNRGQLGQVHTSLSPTTLTLKGDTRTLMERVGSEHE